jgi:hypothetical protein
LDPLFLGEQLPNHGFGVELSMLVGQVMLERLQAARAKLLDFFAAIKDD